VHTQVKKKINFIGRMNIEQYLQNEKLDMASGMTKQEEE